MQEDNSPLEVVQSNIPKEFTPSSQREMNPTNQIMSFSSVNANLDDDHDMYYTQVKPKIIFVKIFFSTVAFGVTAFCLYIIHG